MKDVLIPLGLLAFLCLFVYALISTARKQRRSKSGVFRELARDHGLHYDAEDHGAAQDFARDLDGIGQFKSPSLGKVIPEDVVTGTVRDAPVVLFRHRTKFYEGYSREWFIAGVTAPAGIADRCSVEFLKGTASTASMHLKAPSLKELDAGHFNVVVRAPDETSAGRMMDDSVLKQLGDLARELPFRPEVQIRADRVAVYLADRNATPESAETLLMLLDFSIKVATISRSAWNEEAA